MMELKNCNLQYVPSEFEIRRLDEDVYIRHKGCKEMIGWVHKFSGMERWWRASVIILRSGNKLKNLKWIVSEPTNQVYHKMNCRTRKAGVLSIIENMNYFMGQKQEKEDSGFDFLLPGAEKIWIYYQTYGINMDVGKIAQATGFEPFVITTFLTSRKTIGETENVFELEDDVLT